MVVQPGKRVVERCIELGTSNFSDCPDGLYRPYLGKAHQNAIRRLSEWMQDAGLSTRIDAAGNLIGRYEGLAPNAPALMIGSHIDSVKNAGRFDGPLGVLAGIECVDFLDRSGRRLSYAIEVIAFGDEEGSRFPASMLCSRAVAGTLDFASLKCSDKDGVSLDDALTSWGLSADGFSTAMREMQSVLAYLEVHIEQGPALERDDLPVGVVIAIASQVRYELSFHGNAGHTGTNSMMLRRDALTAAAEAVLVAERVARNGTEDLVATVGRLEVFPGAANVVPGEVRMTLDVRAVSRIFRDEAVREILAEIEGIAARRSIRWTSQLIHDLPGCISDSRLVDRLCGSVTDLHLPVRKLVSGAGHDAMAIAYIAPMVMLFVRCKDGVSHHPSESVSSDDVEIAVQAAIRFMEDDEFWKELMDGKIVH